MPFGAMTRAVSATISAENAPASASCGSIMPWARQSAVSISVTPETLAFTRIATISPPPRPLRWAGDARPSSSRSARCVPCAHEADREHRPSAACSHSELPHAASSSLPASPQPWWASVRHQELVDPLVPARICERIMLVLTLLGQAGIPKLVAPLFQIPAVHRPAIGEIHHRAVQLAKRDPVVVGVVA